MQVHRSPENLPDFKNAVITIGTFDGVHTGHQQIIQQLKAEAAGIGGETVIITFDPHPRKIVNGNQREIRLINTLDEKIELLARNQVDHLVIIPFTQAFSQLSAEEYIRDFLIHRFHPHTIIIGYDHRFGKGRTGDYHLMEEMSRVFGYRLCEIPVHVLNAISVSSTRIREAIAGTEIRKANALLGYPFFFSGRVVEGDRMGSGLGFPTANLQMEDPEKIIPGNGVYAVRAVIMTDVESLQKAAGPQPTDDLLLQGMMNIGYRPTFGGTKKLIEVHLFSFSQSIYGRKLRVYTEEFLRGEIKFDGPDSLRVQLMADREKAIEILR